MADRRMFSGVDLRNFSFTEGTVYMTNMVMAMIISRTTIIPRTTKNWKRRENHKLHNKETYLMAYANYTCSDQTADLRSEVFTYTNSLVPFTTSK